MPIFHQNLTKAGTCQIWHRCMNIYAQPQLRTSSVKANQVSMHVSGKQQLTQNGMGAGIHVSGQDFPSLAGGRAVVIIHYAIIPFV